MIKRTMKKLGAYKYFTRRNIIQDEPDSLLVSTAQWDSVNDS